VALVAFVAVRYIRSRGRDGSGEQPDQTQPPDGTLSPDTQPPLPAPNTHRYFQPLVVTVTDRQAGETYNYPLDNPTVANYGIGTSTGNPIRITRAAPGVSRNHATLTPVKQGWELTDRSTYGTFLGDTPTEEHKIATNEAVAVQPGVQIWIGREIVLTLKSLQAPPPGGDTTITRTLGDETLPPKENFQSPYMTRNLQRNPHSKALRVIVLDTETNDTYPYELDSATGAGYDIGIGQQNAIQIRRNAQGVSRSHARLVPMPDGWKLSDTGGHGTYLGASPDESNLIGRQPVPVQAGATIWIGKDIKLTLEHIQ
jgi:pSer/pThr/pTyr-binding forkhead associated (FHA) protein